MFSVSVLSVCMFAFLSGVRHRCLATIYHKQISGDTPVHHCYIICHPILGEEWLDPQIPSLVLRVFLCTGCRMIRSPEFHPSFESIFYVQGEDCSDPQSPSLRVCLCTYQALKKMLNINVHINGEPINRVPVTKYVGMYIDKNLKWDVHIDKMIIPKISAKISILRSLKNYYQLIPSHLCTMLLFYNIRLC